MALCDLPEDKVRVVQTETGGAFGGKEEYPSMIAAHAALLAIKSGRPVKIIYDRAEDMVATTKRHPSRTRHRTAVSKDGKILGGEIEFMIDGGAYLTLVPGRAFARHDSRGRALLLAERSRASQGCGDECASARGFSRLRRAAKLVCDGAAHGSHRGDALNLSPVEIRRRNLLKPGRNHDHGPNYSRADPIWANLLDRALEHLRAMTPRNERFARENESGTSQKGIGIAAFLHGAGFTGSGERYLSSVVGVEGRADGGVRVLVSSTEFGQGTNTVLCQIAAETLGLPYEDVEIAQPDTTGVPNSGPTVASRTAMVVGKLVAVRRAWESKQTLCSSGMLRETHTRRRISRGVPRIRCGHAGSFVLWHATKSPAGIFWDDQNYRGEAYAAFAWAVYVAEVTVDLATYAVIGGRFRGASGSRQGAEPGSGTRPNYRRRGAGHRICAL